MTRPAWLPTLVLLEDFNGNWDDYLEAVYACFKNDFIDNLPKPFDGKRMALKKMPIENGKEATFWHLISEGKDEATRIPDFRRTERIRWPRAILDNHADEAVRIWRNKRGTEERILLYLEEERYLLVLADRATYVLPWTAYIVKGEHRRQRLLREHQSYIRHVQRAKEE